MIFKFNDKKPDQREFTRTREDGGNPNPTERREQVEVSPDGTIKIPGVGTREMAGLDPGQLKQKAAEHHKRKLQLERKMRSTYKCTQCARVWWGRYVRVKLTKVGGVEVEVLVCADPRCDAPVVVERDALDLRKPPGGDGSAV